MSSPELHKLVRDLVMILTHFVLTARELRARFSSFLLLDPPRNGVCAGSEDQTVFGSRSYLAASSGSRQGQSDFRQASNLTLPS